MAKVIVYDKDMNIVDQLDSDQYSLDQFLAKLVSQTNEPGEISLKIEECFDGTNTYFNVLFVPNVLRVDPPIKIAINLNSIDY